MSEKKCRTCGSDKLIPYRFKPPRADRKGQHTCDETCTVDGTMCLNCRLVTDGK